MDDEEGAPLSAPPEVVIILRLRAGAGGWWGQVQRLGDTAPRYVAGMPDLCALLGIYWRAARRLPAPGDPSSAPREDESATETED